MSPDPTIMLFEKLIANPYLLCFLALNALGWMLKQTPNCPNWLIPYILLLLGTAFGFVSWGAPAGVELGAVMAMVAVGGHQLLTSWLSPMREAPVLPELDKTIQLEKKTP